MRTVLAAAGLLLITACNSPKHGPDHVAPHVLAPKVLGPTAIAKEDTAVVALFQVDTGASCTGTLIAPDWVLTAAHCVTDLDDSSGEIHPMAVSFSTHHPDRTAHTLPLANVHAHPRATVEVGGLTVNDVALIQLDAPVDVTPIPVNLDEHDLESVTAVRVVGYGETNNDENDEGLRRTTMVRLDSTSRYLLSSGPGKHGTCYGDSGGPALARLHGVETVVGVTSFGWSEQCSSGTGFIRTDSHPHFLHKYLDDSNSIATDDPAPSNVPTTEPVKPDNDDVQLPNNPFLPTITGATITQNGRCTTIRSASEGVQSVVTVCS